MNRMTKTQRFIETECALSAQGLNIERLDKDRPWGGFFVIDERQAQQFSDLYFEGMDVQELKISGKLSPKILVVAPSRRLSWQYHHRRKEIWRVIQGEVGVITSTDDRQGEIRRLTEGTIVCLEQGERHRLVGLEDWAVLAEIWQHTDPENPSDEEDIVRVEDDFGR